MTSLARVRPIYWSHFVHNDTRSSSIEATIFQAFNTSVVPDINDFLVTVERFELNLNGVPFYTEDNNDKIEFFDILNVLVDSFVIPTSYSLINLIENINTIAQTGIREANNFSLSIDSDGFVTITYTDFATHTLNLADRLAKILDMPDPIETPAGVTSIKSTSPRFDSGDELGLISLTSNIPVTSDTVGQIRANVLTDFSFPKSLGSSSNTKGLDPNSGGLSWTPRQKLVFEPSVRRYLTTAGHGGLQSIRITANYEDPKNGGTQFPVLLRPGGVFSIKLGFHARI